MNHLANDICPFCGSKNISEVDLIQAYQDYFSREYKNYKENINKEKNKLENKLKDNNLIKIKSKLRINRELMSFWGEYIELENMEIDYNEFESTWNDFKNKLKKVLIQKGNNPLEIIKINEELENSYKKLNKNIEKVKQYNKKVEKINKLIKQEKNNISKSNLQSEKDKLINLKTIKNRMDDEISDCCKEYKRVVEKRKHLKEEKDDLKKELDEFTNILMGKYKEKINDYLIKFGADFKIKEVDTSYVGGNPSVSYNLKMRNIAIETKKVYKDILSEGEKSTLAFAFFLAKISLDSQLEDKIIIFDDPISSLDIHKKATTAKEIQKISKKAKQVIVLTHDLIFAKKVWENHNKKILTLKISHSNDKSKLSPWSINKHIADKYFKHYHKLNNFLKDDNKELDSIATSIRRLMEGNLRMRFPEEFSSDEWLGDFIRKIRDAKSSEKENNILDEKISDKDFEEIKDINDYSKDFHHSDVYTQTENISKRELKAHVKRTIKFCTG